MHHFNDYRVEESDEISRTSNSVIPFRPPVMVTVQSGNWDGVNAAIGCAVIWLVIGVGAFVLALHYLV